MTKLELRGELHGEPIEPAATVAESMHRFVSRLSEADLCAAVQQVLGRRMYTSELESFRQAWRGLLDADDAYFFQLETPRLGHVASLFFFALASDGYAKFDSSELTLIEAAIVTLDGEDSSVVFLD